MSKYWEVVFMATKSILKNINIKNPHLAREFVDALENAKVKNNQTVPMSRKCSILTGDKIKDFFGKK